MNTIMTMAEACKLSYERAPKLEGYRTYPIFWGTTQSFVFVNHENVICAFRGTQGTALWDWVTDIRFTRKRLSGAYGRFHRGFLDAANTVYSQHYARARILGRDRRIWLTGHSLGAGIALSQLALLGARQPKALLRIEGVVTFGGPRITNKEGERWMEQLPVDIVNFQAVGDRICHLPPKVFGYKHVGSVVMLPKTTINPLGDHSMEGSYIPRLESCRRLLCK